MANLEEGELEDGELLSSGEEEEGETATGAQQVPPSKENSKTQNVSNSDFPKPIDKAKSSPAKTNHTSPRNQQEEAPANLNESHDTEDGEIFSDDEEAAYYPHHVRSRPRQTSGSKDVRQSDSESQKSDTESLSGIRSGRLSRDRKEKDRNHRNSPESETDHLRPQMSDSKERGVFFEDREGSGSESTGSRDRTRSRSRERDKDRHSSPKYISRHGNRSRERDRDRSSNRSRNDEDSTSGDRSSGSTHYGRQSGGYGRSRGGYGGYQQRSGYGSSKYQGGGASQGGYTSSVQPGLMNTGMTAQQFHALAMKVKKRREDGLPLLPQPNLDKCGNLDQYNYPAPPSWYLEEVEAWEKREREKEEEKAKEEEKTEENVEPAEESKLGMIIERQRPISPLFRRMSSTALEIVSSPVSDGESPMVVAEPTINEEEPCMDDVISPEGDGVSHDAPQESKSEPAQPPESSTRESPVPTVSDVGGTNSVRLLSELAAEVVQSKTESTPPTSTANNDNTAATVATTTVAIVTTPTAATSTPQSLLPAISTGDQPTANSTTTKSPTKPLPPVTPLTITSEATVADLDDQSRSPSLSPTIPIQSGIQTTGAGAQLPQKTKTFRPKIMSDSDSEVDYDNYLDQLDEEEDEEGDAGEDKSSLLTNTLSEGFPLISSSTAPSLMSFFEGGGKGKTATNQILGSVGDPLSEEFPSIGKEAKSSSNENSLMALIGQEKNTDGTNTSGGKKTGKSVRRKQKDSAWWAKQKEKEKERKQAAVEETKKIALCKYYLNGNCKNGENCAFSHDCVVQKKKEICKFYLQGYCSKGTLCNYYHEVFPCKYIHTKGYCKNGDQCKFSHAPLTRETKELLMTVLDPNQVAVLNATLPHLAPAGSLVVSIPKVKVKGLIVSIPLNKLQRGPKPPPTPITNHPLAPPGPVPIPHQYQNQPPPKGLFPFQQQSGNTGPFLPSAPGVYGAPPHAPPPQPVPLFPPKNQFQRPPFPPNQAPPPSVPPGMPHPPPAAPGPPQRRSLLPTPPPHMMINQEDLKRMERNQHEYWEAPELTQHKPHPYEQQPPAVGGAPPYSGPPPPNQFGRGGFHHQAPPPPGPGPAPFPSQQPPPFGQAPPPQQFGPPAPGQQQAPPFHPPPPGPHPPAPHWNDQQGGGMGMRQKPGMEQNHPPPPGMDPRQSGGGPPPNFPPSRIDPRHPYQGEMGRPGIPPPAGDPRRPEAMEQRPPPSGGHLPGPPQQWHHPPEGHRGGWSGPPAGPAGPAGGPPLAPPPAGSSSPYQRHDGGAPPQPLPPPPRPSQQIPHGFNAQEPIPNVPPHIVPPYQQPPGPGRAPYQPHTAAAAGSMSPPTASGYPVPPQQQTLVGGAQSGADKPSPVWGMSPEYAGGQSPSGGGVASSSTEQTRRRDPRMKYSHLKIKSKGQSSQATGSQPILKRGAGEAGMDMPPSGFKIPKLLQDSAALNRPLDPGELFGGKDALSGGEEKEYSRVTAPFGAFRSVFAQSHGEGSNADSADTTQQFGEITMGADPSPAKAKENNEEEKEKLPSDSAASTEREDKVSESSSKPSEVPSYLAHLNMGLDDDLKIDSAFGALSKKNANEGGAAEGSGQDSQARKLPSIFGFS